VVPGTTGASDGLGAATAGVAEADGVEEPLAPALEDGEAATLGVGVALGAALTDGLAPALADPLAAGDWPGTKEGTGIGVCAGRRSIGSVRIWR
jgi:hypothetical protein